MTADERREQLLDVTKRIAATRGFHAVSIEAVAKEAGISRPIVYGHFGDLAGLLEALIDRESVRALTQLAEVLPQDLSGIDRRDQLLAGLQAYLEAAQADPHTWKLVLMPPEGAPAILRDRVEMGRAAVITQLTDVVRPGLAPGRESPDPELTARMLSTFADDSVRLLLTQPDTFPPERLIAHARWLLEQLPG
jgi:AcrR family transcriptional regulator